VTELVKHFNFVTREFPTDKGFEGLVVSRIIESLPADWRVKVFVIRSQLLSSPLFPALPEVEIILISEPQYKWDNFLLRALRYPLEKLAVSESLLISKRILTNTSASNYMFVFSTSPVLKFVSREFEVAHLSKEQHQDLRASIEHEGEIKLQLFTDLGENITEPQLKGLLEKANDKCFSREVFMTEVSKVFGFSSLLTRKYQITSGVTSEKIDTVSKNKIVNWSVSSQRTTKSDIFILSSKLAFILSPIRVMTEIAQFLSQNLTKGFNGVFKIGYATLKFVFNSLSIVRRTISRKI
jgi:hypothetical protein